MRSHTLRDPVKSPLSCVFRGHLRLFMNYGTSGKRIILPAHAAAAHRH